MPEERYLSALGNQLVAGRLSEYLQKFASHRSTLTFDQRPALFGDEKADFDDIHPWDDHMPYILKTNSQGLRMDYDLSFPKTRQRVLVLGDAYTYGPYLENFETFPAILDRRLEHAEVINAGYGGYTISHEVSLYFERAKYAEPDIVILQVLDNDLEGLVYIHENQYDRHGVVREPTLAEESFIKKVHALHKDRQ